MERQYSSVNRREMICRLRLEVIFLLYNVVLPVGLYATTLRNHKTAEFTFRSIIDAALPAIEPLIDANSDKCAVIKNIFGISYEQLRAKNTSLREEINVDLITKNGNVKYNLTETRKVRKLVQNAETIVVMIHGYLESSEGMMVQAMAPEFLKKKGLKMLALDGRKIINFEYIKSSTYARFMGELLGTFLSHLIQDGQEPSKFHLIGHSLGSHIAGIAGKQVFQITGQSLGRITGLDPAGPCFASASNEERLDRTDASYVDVIHTSGMLGIQHPVGHKDFYPNGGASQTGCILSICDHSRAWELFTESIDSPKAFPARKCENWTMFNEGKCSKHELAYMGFHSDRTNLGTYFLSTASTSPFSLGPAGSG